MLIGTFDKSDPAYYVEIFPLTLSEAFGLVIYRGARAYVAIDGFAYSEKQAELLANEWLRSPKNFAKAEYAFVMSMRPDPFFDRVENIPAKECPFSPLGLVWNNICKGYPTNFSTIIEEVEWEWKLQNIVNQTAADTNYQYQRTKDGTIIWQRKKEPSPCPWCKANQIFLDSDISDREEEEFRYICGCGVSGPRVNSKLQALEYWNELLAKLNPST